MPMSHTRRMFLSLALVTGIGSSVGSPAGAAEDSNKNSNSSSNSNVKISNVYENGRTLLEISVGKRQKITRRYEFPVNVSNSSTSVNGKTVVKVEITKQDGKLIEVIEP